MTSQQREQAVTALAAIITACSATDPDTERLGADYPTLLPPLVRRATLTTPHDDRPGR
jgi:hypothetical protein